MPPFFIAEKKRREKEKTSKSGGKPAVFCVFCRKKKLYKFDISFKMVVSV